MRMIGTIQTDADAERFSDYLVTQNIANMVEESQSGGSWTVWVEHDDDIDRGKSELDAFLKNSADGKYNAQSAAREMREQEEKLQKKRRARYVDVRTNWSSGSNWAAPVTLALIAISMVLSVGTNSIRLGPRTSAYLSSFTYIPIDKDRIMRFQIEHGVDSDPSMMILRYWAHVQKSGEVWRLITPVFMHLSLLHLIFNMFWLRDLGAMIETRRGSWTLLSLVLIAALVSNFGEFIWELPSVGAFGGMSGVTYALFGYIWIKQRYQPHLGIGINDQTRWILLAWLFICMTGMVGSVANAAHVVGLLIGAAYAYAPIVWRRVSQ